MSDKQRSARHTWLIQINFQFKSYRHCLQMHRSHSSQGSTFNRNFTYTHFGCNCSTNPYFRWSASGSLGKRVPEKPECNNWVMLTNNHELLFLCIVYKLSHSSWLIRNFCILFACRDWIHWTRRTERKKREWKARDKPSYDLGRGVTPNCPSQSRSSYLGYECQSYLNLTLEHFWVLHKLSIINFTRSSTPHSIHFVMLCYLFTYMKSVP